MPDYELYVGIDWGSERHHVAVVNPNGERVADHQVAPSGAGLAALVEYLTRLTPDPARVAVAIEVPRGALVDTLLARGYHVFAIHPKQLDRFRDRHTVAGAKDDRRDAVVAAGALRTDRRAFRRPQPDDPRLIQLRELSRTHAELVSEERRLANRLREKLWRYYPPALGHCAAADEPWLWSLLDHAPTPAAGQRQTRSALRALLGRHRIRRFSGDDRYATLQAPSLHVAAGTVEAASEHVGMLVPRQRRVYEQRAR